MRATSSPRRWLFPAYLILINLFVAPLAIAGLATFADGAIDRDLTVLALPLNAGARASGADNDARRAVGGDRHGGGRQRRAGDHRLQRSGDADPVAPSRGAGRRGGRGRNRRACAAGRRAAILAVLFFGFLYARLPPARRSPRSAFSPSSAIAQIAPGVPRRADMAARHRARRERRDEPRFAGVALRAVSAFPRRRRRVRRSSRPMGRSESAGFGPAALVAFSPYPLVGGVVLSLGGQCRGVRSSFR